MNLHETDELKNMDLTPPTFAATPSSQTVTRSIGVNFDFEAADVHYRECDLGTFSGPPPPMKSSFENSMSFEYSKALEMSHETAADGFDISALCDDDCIIFDEMDDVLFGDDGVLPRCPSYFNKNCSFLTRLGSKDVISFIEDSIVETLGCSSLDVQQFSIRGLFYQSFVSVTFVINVFSWDDDTILVEVQRFDGDAIIFSSFYNKFLSSIFHRLRPRTLEGSEMDAPKRWNFKAPELPSGPALKCTAESLGSLLRMADTGSSCEIQKEVSVALAKFSSDETNHSTMGTAETVKVLSRLLASDDIDTVRCAVSCIACLVNDDGFFGVCCQTLLPSLCELVFKSVVRRCDECLKQLCIVLEAVSSREASRLRSFDILSSFRLISRTSDDADVRRLAMTLCENLE